MEVKKISNRGTMFFIPTGQDWDLNCYLIEGTRANYVIDTGRSDIDGSEIADYVRANCACLPTVVINTHAHWDHVWGNWVFRDCQIIARAMCRQMMESTFDRTYEQLKDKIAGNIHLTLPNVTFEDRMELVDEGIYLFASCGHTVDGLCVLDKRDGICYCGDNIGDTVEHPVPYLDSTNEVYLDALNYLKTLQFDTLASGHNILLPKSFLDRIIEEVKTTQET